MTPTSYAVLCGPVDKEGKQPFVIFWNGSRGNRAQHFHAVLAEYEKKGVLVAASEAEAKKRLGQ